MNTSQGKWYDGRISIQHEGTVSFCGGLLHVYGNGVDVTVPLKQVRIDPRLGKTRRSIRFATGEKLETDDQEFIAILEQTQGSGRFFTFVHAWENKTSWVFLALLALVGITYLCVHFAIPALASRAAFLLPSSTEKQLGSQTLEILDRLALQPSKLPVERRNRLTRLFISMNATNSARKNWRLLFRSSDSIGANAFALPSGIIIVTDRLVEISMNEDEIASVLAHEAGHLNRRHSLRMLLQNSVTALLIATISGDLASLSSTAATVPTVLIDAKYSRNFEIEADDAAVSYLKTRSIPVRSYANILKKLEQEQLSKGRKESQIGEFFMDHPLMQERINRIVATDAAEATKTGPK